MRVTSVIGKGDSPFGVSDMAGNVWEWCLTDYEKGDTDRNTSANKRVRRGGSWNSGFNPTAFRVDFRDWNPPVDWSDYIGFRLVRSSS